MVGLPQDVVTRLQRAAAAAGVSTGEALSAAIADFERKVQASTTRSP
jgi:hypothetical protein